MNIKRCRAAFLCVAFFLVGCGPSEKEQAEIVEKQRLECLNNICPGDKEPEYDRTRYQLFKRGGKLFLGPKEYGCYDSCAFYWPSKTPMTGRSDRADYPERGKPFSDVAIEIFIAGAPADPTGAREFLDQAEKNGWIANRKLIRADLEQITQRNEVPGHERTLYVATALKGLDGKPPVAQCSHDHSSHGGGTAFMWKPGFKVWARWNQRHCVDWPEIYTEIINVLNQVKEVQP